MAPELPRAFLRSLRPLYDLLDERRRGSVHLREIESRWLQPGGEAGPLTAGVLEGLRRAASASGHLTFERFVLGLRLALRDPEQGDCADDPPPPPSQRDPRPDRAVPGSLEESSRGGRAEQPLQGKRAAGEAGGVRTPREQLDNEGPCKGPRKQPRALGEQRRHTISNGVDYEMLKALEEEKALLLQGLELVEEARGWYQQQLHRLQGQQKQLAQGRGHQDLPAEGSQAQLSPLGPHLQELNRGLRQLLPLCAKPGNSSPAASHSPDAALLGPSAFLGPQQTIHMLKEQNRLLTQEVTGKGHRITQLEQEKSALIKQLFGARAERTKDSSQLDSTFI